MNFENNFLKQPNSDRLFDFVDTSICGPAQQPGVYAVCICRQLDGRTFTPERILYIGSSNNVQKRIISQHHPYIKIFRRLDEYFVYTRIIYCEDYRALEKKLIKIYRPLLNKQHKNG
jgi:hypothetical protein